MDKQVRVTLTLPGELELFLARAVSDAVELFPNSLRAIAGLAQATQERWIAYASGSLPLPDGRTIQRRSGEYAASIQIEVSYPGGDTMVRYVIYSDDPKARWIEEGFPAWDMHKILQTSHRARVSKRGHKYLIIPFRWGTPGTTVVGAYTGRELPQQVQQWWLEPTRQSSIITGTYTERSVQDQQTEVTRFTYRWGDQLTAADVRGLELDPDTKPGKHLVGMVRMRNPARAAIGSERITFRTMSEAAPEGWRHPGLEGFAPARHAAEWIEQLYPALMEEALNADVERLRELAS